MRIYTITEERHVGFLEEHIERSVKENLSLKELYELTDWSDQELDDIANMEVGAVMEYKEDRITIVRTA